MRITQQSIASRTYYNLQGALRRSEQIQEQLSSGKQVSRPSDGPGQTANALSARQSLRTTEQYIRNSEDATSWLTVADSTLQGVTTTLQRARSLAVQGANSGAMPQTARDALADEVDQLHETLVGLANTTFLGRHIFAGTEDVPAAYNALGEYQGVAATPTPVERRVGPGASVRVDVDGPAVLGTRTGSGNGGDSAFDALEQLADRLRNTPDTVNLSIDDLDVALNKVVAGLADVGSRANRVESMRSLSSDKTIQLRDSLSQIEDVDIAEKIVQMQLQEVAYQAALGATARVLQPSLLDFLS